MTKRKQQTKAKQQATKAHAKSTAANEAAPRPTEPPRQQPVESNETIIFDIIEEPAPGVVVVTEFETIRTNKT